MDDEAFYAEVAQELQVRPPIPGLWAKSYAECDGDEVKAKALYLRLRVEQLKARQTEVEWQLAQEEDAIRRRVSEEHHAAELLAARRDAEENAKLPFFRRKVRSEVVVVSVVVVTMVSVVVATLLHRA